MQQSAHSITVVILLLASDWSSRQFDDSMTNNDKSEARKKYDVINLKA